MKHPLLAITLVFASSSVRLLAMDGFIDKSGKMAIEPRFEAAFSFSEGLAGIRSGKKFGFIDKEGNVKIAPQFDEISYFRGGLARARSGDKWGYIDKNGQWTVPPQFKCAADFSEGLAAVCALRQNSAGDAGSRLGWGYIDATGAMIIAPQFFEAANFSEGLAMVRRTGGEYTRGDAVSVESGIREEVAGYIDKTGAMVIRPQFARGMPFSEGLACVQFPEGESIRGGPSAYIDKSGRIAIGIARWAAPPLEGNSIEAASFHDGLAFHDAGTGYAHAPKWTYIDTKGTVAISLDVDGGSVFSEGLARIMKGKLRLRYGYVNKTGTIVIEPKYNWAETFTEGLAAVKIDKRSGFIDPTGKLVIEARFETASPFSEGLARVTIPK